jgi:hypothetical protein
MASIVLTRASSANGSRKRLASCGFARGATRPALRAGVVGRAMTRPVWSLDELEEDEDDEYLEPE